MTFGLYRPNFDLGAYPHSIQQLKTTTYETKHNKRSEILSLEKSQDQLLTSTTEAKDIMLSFGAAFLWGSKSRSGPPEAPHNIATAPRSIYVRCRINSTSKYTTLPGESEKSSSCKNLACVIKNIAELDMKHRFANI